MRVLITGGAGKIGQKLINRLKAENLAIKILLRKSETVSFRDIELAYGDLLDPQSLNGAVLGMDSIIHLAAVTHTNEKELYFKVNARGTENLVKSAEAAGVSRFIFISTRAIDPAGGAYSQSKLAAEDIVRQSALNWVILRPAEVYGGGENGMIETIISLIRKYHLIPTIQTLHKLFSPIYIDDLISAIDEVILSQNFRNKIYNLAGPDSYTFEEFVDLICDFYQIKCFKLPCPLFLFKLFFNLASMMPASPLVKDQFSRLVSEKSADISLAQRELNFQPRSFFQGLKLLPK